MWSYRRLLYPGFFKILKLIGKYKNIVNYYNEIFNVTRYGDFTYAELIKMVPYEIEIFIALTMAAMEEEKRQREQNK